MSESVLIIGGTGFIGQYATKELSKKFKVYVASRGNKKPIIDFKGNSNVNFISNIDVTNAASLDKLAKLMEIKPVITIYFPAGRGYSWSLEKEIENVTLNGMKNTVSFCKKSNIPKILFIGSASSLLQNYEFTNPYTKAKYLVHQYLIKNSQGIKWLIASPTECMGLGVGGSKTKIINLFSGNSIFKHVRVPGSTNFLDVEDCAKIIAKLVNEFDKWESKNVLLYGTDVSYNQLFSEIKSYKGIETWSVKIPGFILKSLYRTFLSLDKKHLFPSFMKKYPPHTLLAALGVKKYSDLDVPKIHYPCDISNLIKKTMDWYSSKKS